MACIVQLGIVCIVLVVQVIRGCPNGWETYDESCYFVPDLREDWTAASTTCGLYQAHLAEVVNANEDNFLRQLITKHHSGHGGNRYYWLGGTDMVVEGEWRWIKTGQSINYTNWAHGEPNNHHSHEDCLTAHLTSESHFHWVDRQCTYKCYFVCKISAHWIQLG
ncbi:perlucin-like [Mizuhopecten yessoensis]|uniref:Perlucin n=1 Tax=Mizuhopecten yessoensis TaxID=6573 RepID=A0A210PJF7_MIZYE|nr:perlucin-like [Mizuhopecten yessoensis]OWF36632.1 Perlucin [Mizuhopecten yessoensis]